MKVHFEEKKRVAFYGSKQTKILPSVVCLTCESAWLRKRYRLSRAHGDERRQQ
jgi:hypothetical protein